MPAFPYDPPMSAPTLTLRAAAAADQPLLSHLGTQTYLDHFGDFYPPDEAQRYLDAHYSAPSVARDLQDPGIAYWIAEADGRAVGFAKALRARAVPIAGGTGTELQKLYFIKGQTGRGYGEALIEHVARQARDDGAACVWLHVMRTNVHAHRFYLRMGFETLGAVSHLRGGEDVGMWAMKRDVG